MPYLKLYAPEFSFEQKKIMAAELTDCIVTALALPQTARDQVTIQFMPYRLENMAIGGRLLSETEAPDYHLEFYDTALTPHKKEALARQLIPLVMEQLGLHPTEADRLSILFRSCHPGDLAMGGHFSSQDG